MARLRNNILANFAGQAWTVAVSLVFVPFYIRLLGAESYGLVGFMLSLQALSYVLDLGLSATLNRELARRSLASAGIADAHDLLRTFEWVVLPTCAISALAIVALSGPIAHGWLQPTSLGAVRTQHAIQLMGVAIALQWPSSFYAGGLNGLERQLQLNLLNALFATLRAGGAVLVLWRVESTIEAYVWWQIAVSIAQSTASHVVLWRALPSPARRPVFRPRFLRQSGVFAAGTFAVSALGLLIMQADRIALSSQRPLAELGYYTLAVTVAAGLGRLVQPFFTALFPRYSRLVGAGEEAQLRQLYHESTQYLVVLAGTAAVVMAFFARDLLMLWTQDAHVAAIAATPLSLLVLGSALNGLLNLPYALQLAFGQTSLSLRLNLVGAAIVVPASWWAVGKFGMTGAAGTWFAFNLAYIVIGAPLMHAPLLRGQSVRWFVTDVVPPLVMAMLFAAACKLLLPDGNSRWFPLARLIVASGVALLAAAMAASAARARFMEAARAILLGTRITRR